MSSGSSDCRQPAKDLTPISRKKNGIEGIANRGFAQALKFYTSAIPVSTSPFDSGMTQVNARPMR